MKKIVISLALLCLPQCGTSVPQLTQNGDDSLFVEDVHKKIRCEVVSSIHEAVSQANAISKLRGQPLTFFQEWGVRYTLTLKVITDTNANLSVTALNPTAPVSTLNPGNSVATVGGLLSASAKATRTEQDSYFNTVKRLNQIKKCSDIPERGIAPFGNDLGIRPWIITRINLADNNNFPLLSAKDSFTYEVKFEITNRGSLTPNWLFIQRSPSNAGGLFNTGRATAHSVLVTFGPLAKDRQNLVREAQAVHDARLVGEAVNFR